MKSVYIGYDRDFLRGKGRRREEPGEETRKPVWVKDPEDGAWYKVWRRIDVLAECDIITMGSAKKRPEWHRLVTMVCDGELEEAVVNGRLVTMRDPEGRK